MQAAQSFLSRTVHESLLQNKKAKKKKHRIRDNKIAPFDGPTSDVTEKHGKTSAEMVSGGTQETSAHSSTDTGGTQETSARSSTDTGDTQETSAHSSKEGKLRNKAKQVMGESERVALCERVRGLRCVRD